MSLPTIYYESSIENFASTNESSVPLRFSETRALPIVQDVSQYSMSVVRFNLDSYSLPSFIASIQPSPNVDPNAMIQSVTMQYKNGGTITHSGQTYLTFKPTNKHVAVPPAPAPLQASSEYYWLNSYHAVANLINDALVTATVALKATSPTALASMVAPKVIYDGQSERFSVLAQKQFFDSSLTNKVSLFFNRPLYAWITTLSAQKDFAGLNGRIYEVDFISNYGVNDVSLDAGSGALVFIQATQTDTTIGNLDPVSAIGFSSNSLPVEYTQLSAPMTFINGVPTQQNNTNNKEKIITDFTTDSRSKPYLTYNPSAEYRMISMTGSGPLSLIEINAFWRDVQGNQYVLELQSGASCSIVLMFRPKSM